MELGDFRGVGNNEIKGDEGTTKRGEGDGLGLILPHIFEGLELHGGSSESTQR